jgi:hypothetical protein
MSFTEDMDTAVQPPSSLIKIDVDDVQKTAIAFDWLTSRMFRVRYSEGALGPTDVDLKTFTTHPLFRTALGELVFPFDKQAYEFNVTGIYGYNDPDLLITLTFQTTMDQLALLDPDEMIIYANDVPKMPDDIFWDSPTELKIEYSEVALPGDYDIELPDATNHLRCLIGNVMPPFRLNTLQVP